MSFNGEPDGERRAKEGPLASRAVPPVVFIEPPAPAPLPEPEPVEPEPEVAEPLPGDNEYIPVGLGVAATLMWVSGAKERAAIALAAEQASEGPRTALIAELEKIVAANDIED